MSYIKSLLARVDGAINRDIDKSIAERPIQVPRDVPMTLTGISPVKLLDSYKSVRDQAELRKEAIEAELRRLNGALDDTNVALNAIGAAIGVLEANEPVALTADDLALDLHEQHQLSEMAMTDNDFSGHTSPARRLEEYAAKLNRGDDDGA